MDRQAPMPPLSHFPYHFLISYFRAAGQAQCKFCQELRWIRLCLCVCVSVFVSFIRTYARIGAVLLFCSTSSFYLLIQHFGVYEIRGLLIWRLIEFWHECLAAQWKLFPQQFWTAMQMAIMLTAPLTPLSSHPRRQKKNNRAYTLMSRSLWIQNTLFSTTCLTHRVAHNYHVYVPFCIFTVRSEVVCHVGLKTKKILNADCINCEYSSE